MAKVCKFLQDEKGNTYPTSVLESMIYCIPDRRGRRLYYIEEKGTGLLKFVAHDDILKQCMRENKKLQKRIQDKCLDLSQIDTVSEEYNIIREYLHHFHETGGIDDCILDFIEELLMYTHIDYETFLHIMGGAYVVIDGDDGSIYRKFRKCQYEKFSIRIPTELARRPKTRDIIPMSSHGAYMSDAYRIGQGNLVMCDLHKKYSDSRALENPRFDILVGKSIDERYKNQTAFQLESCRMGTTTSAILHTLVWFEYKYVGKNVGAFGYSTYTDRNPLVLKSCGKRPCLKILDSEKVRARIEQERADEEERKRRREALYRPVHILREKVGEVSGKIGEGLEAVKRGVFG